MCEYLSQFVKCVIDNFYVTTKKNTPNSQVITHSWRELLPGVATRFVVLIEDINWCPAFPATEIILVNFINFAAFPTFPLLAYERNAVRAQ
jgi:hypothetical protein